jgi:hypothetical protein
MPVMAHNLLEAVRIMGNVCDVFVEKCIDGLEANRERCEELIEQSLAMCTSLAPHIGYDQAAAIAKEAYSSGKTVRQVALEKKVLDEATLNQVLDPRSMTDTPETTPPNVRQSSPYPPPSLSGMSGMLTRSIAVARPVSSLVSMITPQRRASPVATV